jgi:hypothetical protein
MMDKITATVYEVTKHDKNNIPRGVEGTSNA